MTAKEIAEKYAGQLVKCKVTKSSPVTDSGRKILDTFDAKVIGWKERSSSRGTSYVCVEVLPPGMTSLRLSNFSILGGYHFTSVKNKNAFGKKLFADEVILPVKVDGADPIIQESKKIIPEWPDKCRDCGSPAVIMTTSIDCSNISCKNKFKTHSGLDLFLPKDMRPPGWDKNPHRKRRAGVDQDDFIVCGICHVRANNGSFIKDKTGTFKASCPANHTWTFELNIGDKLVTSREGYTLIYKGKNIFIPYISKVL